MVNNTAELIRPAINQRAEVTDVGGLRAAGYVSEVYGEDNQVRVCVCIPAKSFNGKWLVVDGFLKVRCGYYPLNEVELLEGDLRDLEREMGVEHVMGDSDSSFQDYESRASLGSSES